MQGVIFTILNDYVVDNLGLDVWNTMIDKVAPQSGGIYTSSANYSDEELFGLVTELSSTTDIPAEKLIAIFGEHLFTHLIEHMPEAAPEGMDFTTFMLSIDRVIHKEVERLYPSAYLPKINFSQNTNTLIMHYASKRKLCKLAEGLTTGAANYFNQNIELLHPVCMHDGEDHCEIHIKLIN